MKVTNSRGLHLRPATVLAKLSRESKSKVSILYLNTIIDAHSMVDILLRGIKQNSNITISVKGADASETMQKIYDAFKNQFGETC